MATAVDTRRCVACGLRHPSLREGDYFSKRDYYAVKPQMVEVAAVGDKSVLVRDCSSFEEWVETSCRLADRFEPVRKREAT